MGRNCRGSRRRVLFWSGAVALLMIQMSALVALADWRDVCGPLPDRLHLAPERALTIDTAAGKIAGTLTSPSNQTPTSLVLMLHGYTGARNEIPVADGEGMFVRTARSFAARGIASLRIDFIGSGESDGEWADTRFSGQARDVVSAAEHLRTTYAGLDIPLSVLGYSQGGLVALLASSAQTTFDKVALWNPVMDPMRTYSLIFGQDVIMRGAEQYSTHARGEIVGETRLRPGFFKELVDADPISDAAAVNAPIFLVTGRKDPLVVDGAALAQTLSAGRSPPTIILDLDAGHDLGAMSDTALLDDVIDCTAAFFINP